MGCAGLDLNGKPVAVFGLGDQISYADYFCDAMEEVYRCAFLQMSGHDRTHTLGIFAH